MSLHRISALSVLMVALGGSVVLADPNSSALNSDSQNSYRPGMMMAQMGPFGDGQQQPKWLQQMNLSPDQIQKMQEIRNRYKPQMQQRMEALMQSQKELQEMMATDASDNQIRQKHQEVQNRMQQLAEVRFESMLAMRQILTPQQRKQFVEHMNQRRGNMRNMPGNGQ